MTLAGVASLFVAHDYLEPPQLAEKVGRPPFTPALARGLAWLEDGDRAVEIDSGRHWGYTLYGVERVGLASGMRFLGKHDWYRELAARVVAAQEADGSWGEEVQTSYALLFLARGRHPILMNKLRFDGFWANRPRDVANLARFASRELERPLNWQVVNIERDWTDWNESPILYLSSHEAPKFTDEQVEKIRQFVAAGGLLYTQADSGAGAFDQWARELAKRLWPEYPMTPLAGDHPVYSMLYRIEPLLPPLMGVSNGVRALMIHSPQDVSMAWQQRMEKTRQVSFKLGVNLFLYAAGKADLRNRIADHYIPEPPAAGGGTIRVARLKYAGGHWDPEPYAWTRFARWFGWETGCGVEVKGVDFDGLDAGAAPLAHLTGSAAFSPTEDQASALRRYIDGGGVLLIDCAGGSTAFADSALQLLANAFPDAALKPLSGAHPLFHQSSAGMEELGTPEVRRYAIPLLGKGAGIPETLVHGKGRVIFTSLDLTSALLGTNTWAILGYSPAYGQSLLKNLILWTAAEAAAPPPAGAPPG
jgi:hypothetical protein